MNNNSSSKNDQNIIAKLDHLIDKINHQTITIENQTKTIENQTDVINQLRSESQEKDAKLAEKDDIIKKLKEQLGMNSQNSSKPPSTDGFNKPTPKSLNKPSGKKPGGQKGRKGKGLTLFKVPDETIKHYPSKCEGCPSISTCTSLKVAATRYECDIVLETKLICHKQMSCSCPIENNKKMLGTFPDSIRSSMQYGSNLSALVVTLNTTGMIAVKRLHDILKAMFNIPISTGTINKMIASMSEKLNPALDVIKDKVISSEVVHFDETGIPVNGKNHWIHCSSTDSLTYLSVDKKRGEEGMTSIGVLPHFNGTAIHDCWQFYFKFPVLRHGLCIAHVLRELTGIFENNPKQLWADNMIDHLMLMKTYKDNFISNGFNEMKPLYLEHFLKRYDDILEEGIQMNPLPEKVKGKRGKPAKGKTRALLDRLSTHKASFCLFLTDFDVPFTNNQAERDIRMSKVKKKIVGTFRTSEGADAFVKTMAYVGTMAKNGVGAFEAIKVAVEGRALGFLLSVTE